MHILYIVWKASICPQFSPLHICVSHNICPMFLLRWIDGWIQLSSISCISSRSSKKGSLVPTTNSTVLFFCYHLLLHAGNGHACSDTDLHSLGMILMSYKYILGSYQEEIRKVHYPIKWEQSHIVIYLRTKPYTFSHFKEMNAFPQTPFVKSQSSK